MTEEPSEDEGDDATLEAFVQLAQQADGGRSGKAPPPRGAYGAESSGRRNLGTEDMSHLVSLMMMKELKEIKKDREAGPSGSPGLGVAKSLKAHAQLKADVQKRPRKFVKEYLTEVKARLGIATGQTWTLRDQTRQVH